MPPALKNFPTVLEEDMSIPKLNSLKDALTTKSPKKGKKIVKYLLLSLLFLIGFLGILTILLLPSALAIKSSGTRFKTSLDELQAAAATKDLRQISEKIKTSKEASDKFSQDVSRISWLRIIPWVGNYASDARSGSLAAKSSLEAAEIVVTTIEPYADILGFSGGQHASDSAQTAQDRITFIVETIDKIAPQLDPIGEKLSQASTEMNKINPARYPVDFQGTPVRELLTSGQQLLSQAATLTHDAKPLLEAAPYMLGLDSKRTYLSIFQNDAELRPTGGFMTAYAILEIDKGKVKPLLSDDIYKLDDKYRPTITAPDVLIKYISYPYQTDPRWRLRDMNLSPDFKSSMETFLPEYAKTNSPKIDGVIAVDTQLLVYLLQVTGRIGVPGYGNFSAETDPRCNCPNVVYELESYADVAGPIVWDPVSGKIVFRPPHSDNRKGIIGPLMNSILANSVAQPKEKIDDLFQVFFKAVQEKHLLMYFPESGVQEAVESFNMAGRVREYDGDYLYVVGSNFAGAKSNMYVTSDIEDIVKVNGDGTVEHELTVNFSNPQKHDGWLNGVYRNWFRVYVPQGSELIDSTGSEVQIDKYEEFGKTVYSGFITVRPEGGLSRLTLRYKTPSVAPNGKYQLLIQKQPGTRNDHHILTINGTDHEFELNGDREISQRI